MSNHIAIRIIEKEATVWGVLDFQVPSIINTTSINTIRILFWWKEFIIPINAADPNTDHVFDSAVHKEVHCTIFDIIFKTSPCSCRVVHWSNNAGLAYSIYLITSIKIVSYIRSIWIENGVVLYLII